jgi:hypothetical protein
MCQKFNRKCPGPGSGPVIIDMTAKTKSNPTRTKQSSHTSSPMQHEMPQPMTLNIQISSRYALNEHFYSTFLAYFTATGEGEDLQNQHTWLQQLPTFSTDGSNMALEIAVQATASAFSGVKHGVNSQQGPQLLQKASALYGKALHMHSRLLRLKKEITVHMVSTSVLLSIFEAMHATTASAYCEHLNGAAKMIEVAGPEQCMKGVLCQIYFHIRTQLTFVYLTSKKHRDHQESAERILRRSLNYDRLPIMQRLLTLISRLSELYVRFEEDGDEQNMHQQLADADTFLSVRTAVTTLEKEYHSTASEKGHTLTTKLPNSTILYHSPYTAVCVAYFATARLLLFVLAQHLPVVHVDPTDYADIVLEATRFLKTVKIGCAFMRMATPLYLLAAEALRVDQRMEALAVFEGWKVSGLGGVSALALRKIHERGAKDATAMLGEVPSAGVVSERGCAHLLRDT